MRADTPGFSLEQDRIEISLIHRNGVINEEQVEEDMSKV
jgi:hypothetical protein